MVSTTSLVSYWKLDEPSGTRSDSIGTNHLTDNNTVASGTGKIGNAADFEFSNGNETLSCASNSTLQMGDIDFSICAWVNIESNVHSYHGIVTKDSGGGRDYFLVYDGTVNRFIFYVQRGGGDVKVQADTFGTPSFGTWYFVTAWHNAATDTLNIQVNNGAVDSVATGGALDAASTTAVHIGGAAWGAGTEFDGMIDEVSLWKRVLTTQDRTDLYNAGAGLTYSFSAASMGPPPYQRRWRYQTRRRVA